MFSLRRSHRGDRFKLVESQDLQIMMSILWLKAITPELAAWEWHRVLNRVTVRQTVATLGRLVNGADLLQELLGPPGVTASQGAVGPGQTCKWCFTMLSNCAIHEEGYLFVFKTFSQARRGQSALSTRNRISVYAQHCQIYLHVWSWAGTRGCSWFAERHGWCSTPGCSCWRNTLQIDSIFLPMEIGTASSLMGYLQSQDWSWNRYMCRDFTNLYIFIPYESWVYQEVVLVSRRNHHLSGAEAVRRVNRGSN